MRDSPLLCIVTGMEHSGTTFLSKLLCAHPRVNTAFECGILLADSPAGIPEVKPWAEWFSRPVEEGHWGLTAQLLLEVAAAPDWDGAYAKLIEFCAVFGEGEDRIIDKTPFYMSQLGDVLRKMPETPCFVLQRDALLLYQSYKRRGFEPLRFANKFNLCHQGLLAAEREFKRIRRVSQRDLATDSLEASAAPLYEWLGLDFDPKFVSPEWGQEHLAKNTRKWLHRKPYDYEAARASLRTDVTADEIAILRANLDRSAGEALFEELDAWQDS